jgi:hypothetical protein
VGQGDELDLTLDRHLLLFEGAAQDSFRLRLRDKEHVTVSAAVARVVEPEGALALSVDAAELATISV